VNILNLNGINTFYGISHILFDIDMAVEKGSITGLLGRNGAGKTTTLKTIMGLTPAKSGTILFKDKETTGMPGYKVAKCGIAYVPDDRQIFAPLSVYENLIIGIPKGRRARNSPWTINKIYDLFPVLKGKAQKGGTHISGGEQKMLAVGRALMCNPDLLLLDEPTEGLAPLIVETLGEKILNIGKEGLTILVADQNVNFARKIIGYGYIIDKGCIENHAPMQEIWSDKDMVCRYLAV
jgi:branched-chain amino acid transport system ATP-binding protein